jgi:hypothetical protein
MNDRGSQGGDVDLAHPILRQAKKSAVCLIEDCACPSETKSFPLRINFKREEGDAPGLPTSKVASGFHF